VLTAAANPQEVLDAGNWLLQNQTLKGSALNAAAEKVGFTPPMRALLPFPATVDMMCLEMAWTTELGQAFINDQQGVLDAVQRLRLQAQLVGNLKDSPQMVCSVEEQDGEEVIYIKPANPEVVYVPQYDPVAAYAPATTTVPATTTTTVVEEGHSTGALVTTGLLAFGAGLLVADLFDDDDDWDDDWNDYYPRYGYGGGYYRPPYPYRPVYGNGYYPNHGYNRPPNYNNGWQNNGNINTGDININTGGNRVTNTSSRLKTGSSPISKANPTRDMAKVNDRTNKNRAGATAGASDWKGQSGYAGAKKPSTGKPTAQTADRARQQASAGGKTMPKQQGGYNGAKNASRDAQRPSNKTASRDVQKPQNKQAQQRPQQQKPQNKQAQQRPQQQKPQNKQAQQHSQSRDRGHSSGGSRQQTASRQSSSRNSGSMSGASRGGADRAASSRGKQSSGGGSSQKSRR
jgi:hypothetical protein